jgi:hypothetical protein
MNGGKTLYDDVVASGPHASFSNERYPGFRDLPQDRSGRALQALPAAAARLRAFRLRQVWSSRKTPMMQCNIHRAFSFQMSGGFFNPA